MPLRIFDKNRNGRKIFVHSTIGCCIDSDRCMAQVKITQQVQAVFYSKLFYPNGNKGDEKLQKIVADFYEA